MLNKTVVILDNGAYSAKVGWNGSSDPTNIPNCVMKAKSERRRAFIGNQIEECRDASGLFYILGFQKGFLLNWDVQKTVWDHIFSPDCTDINLQEKTLIITEPQFNFNSIQEATAEIFFEEYECDGLVRTTAADLTAINYAVEKNANYTNCIVIDIGYSFTHIVPFIKGKPIKESIRRIEIGGKVLTNHLKEIISYRHLNVMDESYVVNQLKEDVCYVSEYFKKDMQIQSLKNKGNTIVREYVLPDFTSVQRGYIRTETHQIPDQQIIQINNERFTIPEILFNPSDVGINQMGIPEAVIDCMVNCPSFAHNVLMKNIIVVGGSSLFPGMKERLLKDIRAMTPDDIEVNIYLPENPTFYAWQGGNKLSKSSSFNEYILTKAEYEEHGVLSPIKLEI